MHAKQTRKTVKFPCNRYGAQQVGQILRQAREAKGWVLRDLSPHGICFGTASHYENGLLHKYMDARIVARLLHVLQPLNPTTGNPWSLEDMQLLANSTSREPESNI